MFVAEGAQVGQFLVVGRIVLAAGMGVSIRKPLVGAFGAVAAAAAGAGSSPAVLALVARSSHMGTLSVGENLRCCSTAPAIASAEDIGHYNTAAVVDPEA